MGTKIAPVIYKFYSVIVFLFPPIYYQNEQTYNIRGQKAKWHQKCNIATKGVVQETNQRNEDAQAKCHGEALDADYYSDGVCFHFTLDHCLA